MSRGSYTTYGLIDGKPGNVKLFSPPICGVMLSKAKIKNTAQEVVIRGDRNVRWERIAAVMSACGQAAITRVSTTVEVREAGGG